MHVCFCLKPCGIRERNRFVSAASCDGGNCFLLFEWPSLAPSPSFPLSLISFLLSILIAIFFSLSVSVCRKCVRMYWFPPQFCPHDTVWLACWHHKLIDDDSSVNITNFGTRKGHREFTLSHLWLNSCDISALLSSWTLHYRGTTAW